MPCLLKDTEIILTGTVGALSWWDDSFFTYTDVVVALAQAGDETPVTVRLNSGGGLASEGAAIHAALSGHKGGVDVVVEGWAASAASLIAMAGRTLTLCSGSLLMIHNPGTETFGDALAHQQAAERLQVMTRVYARVYAERSGKSLEAMLDAMQREVWLGPEEAVVEGFATAGASLPDPPPAPVEPVAFPGWSLYANPPPALVAHAQRHGWATFARGPVLSSSRRLPTMTQPTPPAPEPVAPPAPASEKAPPKAPAADDASASSSPTDRAREITELCALAGQSAAEAAALIASDQSVEQIRHALITARATASSPPLATSLSSPVATALPRRERF